MYNLNEIQDLCKNIENVRWILCKMIEMNFSKQEIQTTSRILDNLIVIYIKKKSMLSYES